MTPKAFLAICVGYGAGIWFSFLAIRKQSLMRRARSWLTATGRILESAIYKDLNGKKLNFRIRYEFSVGERVEGETPRLSGDWFWSGKQQEAFVARFVPGQPVEVFYNPRDPKQNCLDRQDGSGISAMWVIAVGGILLASLLAWLQTQ